eukprot:2464318-Prymnesium_polylepis.3
MYHTPIPAPDVASRVCREACGSTSAARAQSGSTVTHGPTAAPGKPGAPGRHAYCRLQLAHSRSVSPRSWPHGCLQCAAHEASGQNKHARANTQEGR